MEISKKPEIFVGSCQRSLDDKNRLSIPTRFRTQLERAQKEYDAIYVFCLPHHNAIRIYTYDGWLEFAQPKLDSIPDAKERMKRTQQIYALLDEQSVDAQGRIKIDKKFLKAVGIEKNVQLTGIGRGIQLTAVADETDVFNLTQDSQDFIDNLLF